MLPREIPVGISRTEQGEQIVDPPCLSGSGRNDLLRQNVERIFRNVDSFQFALPNRGNEGCTLDEFIPRSRK